MSGDIFAPADILLPKTADMTKWSVIACDQFSSERDYWARVRRFTAGAPTTLDMIVPEAHLRGTDMALSSDTISGHMREYLQSGFFKTIPDSMVYLERTLPGGQVRRGLIGAIDLEAYDFEPGTAARVRASERTAADRLPARLDIRRAAPLELTHVMAFVGDAGCRIIEPFSERTGALEALYDFELMEGGGRVRGWRVAGDDARAAAREISCPRRGQTSPSIIIGDGNHSLAAAKEYWNELKSSEGAGHPARYALVELNNIYDSAIELRAIHRAVFGASPDALMDELQKALPPCPGGHIGLRHIHASEEREYMTDACSAGELYGRLQDFLDGYSARTGCTVDYIHGESSVRSLSGRGGGIGFIMPAMDKADVFGAVESRGCFPKKTFSVGYARDKRYYLECRAINA
ncbi:MAG: DUF1015 domain-containing protein [Oscillospiraceae bacterium]|nr:DUF1015 domain-containing protein [Oscillospiraceae bacterium]